MIVALIEKIYSFLWGDLLHIPLPGKQYWYFITYYIVDSDRNLFYDPHKIFINPTDAGYDKSSCREKRRKIKFIDISDIAGIYSNQSRNGKSCRCCSGDIGRRSRIRLLDVAYGFDRFMYSICRGNAGTAT